MSNPVDNKGEKKALAEDLYERYKATRESQASLESNADVTGVLHNQDPEQVYKHYQTSRHDAKQASIDSIMDAIERDSVQSMLQDANGGDLNSAQETNSPQLQEQSITSQELRPIQSIDAVGGHVSLDDKQGGSEAANAPSLFKRFAIPAIAAALLTAVILPLVMNNNEQTGAMQVSVPASLIEQAPQLVSYINGARSSTFGFSAAEAAPQTAFQNGMAATDVTLLGNSDQQSLTTSLLQGIAKQPAIRLPAEQLSAVVNNGADENTVLSARTVLLSALQTAAEKVDQADWFAAGQLVESIHLAAEYALETSDIEPLEQSLALIRQADAPRQSAPASAMLSDLQQIELLEAEPFVGARNVLLLTDDIKLLMR